MTLRLTASVLVVGLCGAATVRGQDPDDPFLVPADVRRYALVIGAERYETLDPVPNALNDAARIAQALSGLQFSTIRHVPNPTLAQLNDFVNELAQEVAAGPAIVLFFYAGHGFQHEGFNYIVPVNASRDDLLSSSLAVMNILGTIVGEGPGMSIFLLDACRTITSSGHTPASAGPNPLGAGFAAVGITDGAILGFAAQFGAPARSEASAGATNSPYTAGLLKYLDAREISLDQMLDQVRIEVRQLTGNAQSPQVMKGATSSAFAFRPGQGQRDVERQHWEQSLRTGQESCVRRYMESHPDSPYLSAALQWLAQPARGAGRADQPCPD